MSTHCRQELRLRSSVTMRGDDVGRLARALSRRVTAAAVERLTDAKEQLASEKAVLADHYATCETCARIEATS